MDQRHETETETATVENVRSRARSSRLEGPPRVIVTAPPTWESLGVPDAPEAVRAVRAPASPSDVLLANVVVTVARRPRNYTTEQAITELSLLAQGCQGELGEIRVASLSGHRFLVREMASTDPRAGRIRQIMAFHVTDPTAQGTWAIQVTGSVGAHASIGEYEELQRVVESVKLER